jgi:hypothetical protein
MVGLVSPLVDHDSADVGLSESENGSLDPAGVSSPNRQRSILISSKQFLPLKALISWDLLLITVHYPLPLLHSYGSSIIKSERFCCCTSHGV